MMYERHEWRLLALAAVLGSGLTLAACSDENGAGQAEQSTEPAPNTQDDAAPADAVRALLVPGYVFPPEQGGTLETSSDGGVADSGPVFGEDGQQTGYVSLLTADGAVVVYDDPSSSPEHGFVFIPYYVNTGGSGTVLTLGYFQLADGVLAQRSVIFVDDRAKWEGLDYLGEGQFLIRALTHGPNQPMADASTTPMTIAVEREGDTIVETERSVNTDAPAAGAGMGSDENGTLVITVDGLGPITAQSTYADVSLSGFLPGYDLTRADEAMSEAGVSSLLAFEGADGTVRVEYVLDGPLISISSTDPAIGNALVRPGDRMVDHWKGMDCAPGLEVFAVGLICAMDATPHLAVYFSGPMPENVPDGWAPEPDDPLAGEWTAEEVLWLDNVAAAQADAL